MKTGQTTAVTGSEPLSDAEAASIARRVARHILALQRKLADEETKLKQILGANGKVTVDGGTFTAVTGAWRPNAELQMFLLERKLLAACLVQRPTISMAKVTSLAAKKPELAAFITLRRASAAEKLVLRFRAATDKDESVPEGDG